MAEQPQRRDPDRRGPEEGAASEAEPDLTEDVPHRDHSVDEEAAIEQRRRGEDPNPRE